MEPWKVQIRQKFMLYDQRKNSEPGSDPKDVSFKQGLVSKFEAKRLLGTILSQWEAKYDASVDG